MLLRYHEATKHSPQRELTSPHVLDWAIQPLPFKIYTSLEPLALPLTFSPSTIPALSAIAGQVTDVDAPLDLATLARLCYFANGITRVLRRFGQRIPFRAAACTGALYHIELYAVCADIQGLDAGVFHYGAHDNALRRLRRGDFRRVLIDATGGEPAAGRMADAEVVLVCTSTFWRNSWKYRARAYRHTFWDCGTILANLLAVASANGVSAQVVQGFADEEVNRLLDVDPSQEATVCLVSVARATMHGRRVSVAMASPPPVEPLALPTQKLSARQVDYPAIAEAHTASSLASGAQAAAWRAQRSSVAAEASSELRGEATQSVDSIEAVILRRGSSRRFSHQPITRAQLEALLRVASTPVPSDVGAAGPLTQPYVIVSAVSALNPGTYQFDRRTGRLEPLAGGDFRQQATWLALGQPLAGAAAANIYWLSRLQTAFDRLGERGYRAAQLEAAIEAGKLYLAAYALHLGATGLTFFDDEVIRFFSPAAAAHSVMFLIAVGHPG